MRFQIRYPRALAVCASLALALAVGPAWAGTTGTPWAWGENGEYQVGKGNSTNNAVNVLGNDGHPDDDSLTIQGDSSSNPAGPDGGDLSLRSRAVRLFSVTPALFVENAGQWPGASVRFVHHGKGANVLLTDDGPVFEVFRREGHGGEGSTQSFIFRAHFVGARAVRPQGQERSITRFNYYVGDDHGRRRTGVASYERVVYAGLYPGIDLVVHGRRSHLKYEFHVAPGADPAQIVVRYEGTEGLSIEPDGRLRVRTPLGDLLDDAPYVYQEINGRRVEVAAAFALVDGYAFRFQLPTGYHRGVELVIDPDLAWSTYLGGNEYEWGHGIAVDGAGNVLVGGWTRSSGWVSGGFDTNHDGKHDVFVAKLSSDGAHLWSTYLGGSEEESGRGIAADGAGNVLVTGYTRSPGWVSGGFDTSHNGFGDGFVAKLSSQGAHLWSTYLGGSKGDGGGGIAADGAGDVLVTGYTWSSGWVSGTTSTAWT